MRSYLSSSLSRIILVFSLLSLPAAKVLAERPPPTSLIKRHAPRPPRIAPSRAPLSNLPDGHKALAQELRGRGLSGSYTQLIFVDVKHGGTRVLAASAVQNFWHGGGRWHYKHRGLTRMADRLIVETIEGRRVEVVPSRSYQSTPSVFISAL